jgi:hypothetical protein
MLVLADKLSVFVTQYITLVHAFCSMLHLQSSFDAEQEVHNYWRALDRVEEFAEAQIPITEAFVK